jgi:hypothetical protein
LGKRRDDIRDTSTMSSVTGAPAASASAGQRAARGADGRHSRPGQRWSASAAAGAASRLIGIDKQNDGAATVTIGESPCVRRDGALVSFSLVHRSGVDEAIWAPTT